MEFDYYVLLENLAWSANNPDHVIAVNFANSMLEFSKSFEILGKALKMAFSDISDKSKIILKNAENSEFEDIQQMVLHEIENGTHTQARGKSASTARTVLRLMWFLDFLYVVIDRLVNTEDELKKVCADAYN